MRKIITGAFLSLDGVMQAPGAPEEDPTGGFKYGGWSMSQWDDTMGAVMGDWITQPYDLLLGRKTYEIFAAYWPNQSGNPISDKFNAVTKYVVTSSQQQPLNWQNSVRVTGNVPAEIAKLKQGDGPNLLTQGSSVLIQTLLTHNLIDEFRLMIYPLVLGKGKRLFGNGTMPTNLKLADQKTSTTGVLINTYVPAGKIPIGSADTSPPSADELARRERMKREG